MARREYFGRWPCAEPGCRETANYIYDTQRDYREAAQRHRDHPWRCLRHGRPESVLSADRRICRTEAVASRVPYKRPEWLRLPGVPDKEYLDGLFWIGGDVLSSGFTAGPGFKAFANDFPEGTRLVITAEVVLPDGD